MLIVPPAGISVVPAFCTVNVAIFNVFPDSKSMPTGAGSVIATAVTATSEGGGVEE